MTKYLLLLLLVTISTASAAELTTETPLNFGKIAIRNNNSISTVSISRTGAPQSTGAIYILTPGTPGVYTLSGLPTYINVNLSVDLPATSAMNYPNTAQFSMTAVDHPSAINMGPTGTAQFKMGGTLSTSGNGTKNYYSGAEYVVYVNLNLDY